MFQIDTPDQPPEQNAYAARLYARRGEAVTLQRVEVKLDGWKPRENECHLNATEIHCSNSAYLPVRGWSYFDFDGLLNKVHFVAHSAVRTPEGQLCDVTPSRALRDYPFIPAEESEEEFAALVEGGNRELWHTK